MKSTIPGARGALCVLGALGALLAGCQAPVYSLYSPNPYYPEAAMRRMGQNLEYEFYRNMQLRAPDYL